MPQLASRKWRPNAEIAWYHNRYPGPALVHKTRESDFGKNDMISMRSSSSNTTSKTKTIVTIYANRPLSLRRPFLESPGNLPGPISVFGDKCFSTKANFC